MENFCFSEKKNPVKRISFWKFGEWNIVLALARHLSAWRHDIGKSIRCSGSMFGKLDDSEAHRAPRLPYPNCHCGGEAPSLPSVSQMRFPASVCPRKQRVFSHATKRQNKLNIPRSTEPQGCLTLTAIMAVKLRFCHGRQRLWWKITWCWNCVGFGEA